MQPDFVVMMSVWLFQMQDNKAFLSMINSVLNTDGFFFTTDYDLTHTLQRLANTSPEFQEMTLLERVRERETLSHICHKTHHNPIMLTASAGVT